VVDGILQGLARFFEQRCRSGFAWCQASSTLCW
jgi:hypothetical protein